MPNAIQPDTDPGSKDSLPVSAVPPIPFVKTPQPIASDATTATGGILGAGTRAASVVTFASGNPITIGVNPGDVLRIIDSSGGTTLDGTSHVVASVAAGSVTLETVFGGGEDTAITLFVIERRFFSFDNVMFSNVQKRTARVDSRAGKRDAIYMRLPGFVNRPIRPRKFIHVGSDAVYAARDVTIQESGTDGDVDLGARTLTSASATFITNGVVPSSVVIISDAGSSNGRYVVVEVVSETVLRLDRPTPVNDDLLTYSVIVSGNFVDVANKLIAFGSLEVRGPDGVLVDPVLPR